MNSLLYHCFPPLFMVPHSPFADRCHQSFRQFKGAIEYIRPPQKKKQTMETELCGI